MKNELMIDIETTGTNPGCKVLTLGAFGFAKDGSQVEFYRRFSILRLCEEGFQDDVATMDWWRKKDKDAFDEAFGGKDDPKEGLAEFKQWCYANFAMGAKDGFKVWCKGIDFDFPILKFFLAHFGHHFPWKFWDQYDYRTISKLFPVITASENNGMAHSAIEDAKAQMRGLRAFYSLTKD